MVKTPVHRPALSLLFATLTLSSPYHAQSIPPEAPAANPARPTVTNPATLVPVGYLQFESGIVGANSSPGVSTLYEYNQVVKLAVASRLQFSVSSGPAVRYTSEGVTGNGTDAANLGAQVILTPGKDARPTIAAGYFRSVYDGDTPDLDIGSAKNSIVLYVSGDVKGFRYDANSIWNEVIDREITATVRRGQFGQTLSISHPVGKGFGVSGEIWWFTQPFLRGNAVGNLWAVSYTPRRNLVIDAAFEKGLTSTSTHWQVLGGFTYLLPRKLWGR